MGVSRDDYLMWGCRIDPARVSEMYDDLEAEMDGADGRRFDLVYDVMSGKYAVAGKIIVKSGEYDGIEFHDLAPDIAAWDTDVVTAVRRVFPEAETYNLMLFSHYH